MRDKKLAELESVAGRLYEAAERGLLPINDTLQEREQKLKARQESVLLEMAGTRRQGAIPFDNINVIRFGLPAPSTALRISMRGWIVKL